MKVDGEEEEGGRNETGGGEREATPEECWGLRGKKVQEGIAECPEANEGYREGEIAVGVVTRILADNDESEDEVREADY